MAKPTPSRLALAFCSDLERIPLVRVRVRVRLSEFAFPADLGHGLLKVVAAGAVASSPKVGAVVKLGKASVAAAEDIVDLHAHGGRQVAMLRNVGVGKPSADARARLVAT